MTTDLALYQQLISQHPCFAKLNPQEISQLASLFTEKQFVNGDKIVQQEDLVDSIAIILEGTAEVIKANPQDKKNPLELLATLGKGETIGLSDTGFFSSNSQRTASVVAATPVRLIELPVDKFAEYLDQHPHLQTGMRDAASEMVKIDFIKQASPFSNLPIDQLRTMAQQLEEKIVPADTVIFSEGDKGDNAYLLLDGEIEVFKNETNNSQRKIAQLIPPALFGEAALLISTNRNATAKTIKECKLLVFTQKRLLNVAKNETESAEKLTELTVKRSQPMRYDYITATHRQMADGQTVSTLKNPKKDTYMRLSEEGWYIWEQLDGQHTLQEITLSVSQKFNIFTPDAVYQIAHQLIDAGFAQAEVFK